jgi:hypothetical protein
MVSTPRMHERSSLIGRALHRFASLLVAVCIGIVATLAWQSHGRAARQMIAGWAGQHRWASPLVTRILPPSTESAVEPPNPPAAQAAAMEAAAVQPASVPLMAAAFPRVGRGDAEQLAADPAIARMAGLQQDLDGPGAIFAAVLHDTPPANLDAHMCSGAFAPD